MDKNLITGPRADEKFEKPDLQQTKVRKMGPKKCRTPLSSSLRSDYPQGQLLRKLGCNFYNQTLGFLKLL